MTSTRLSYVYTDSSNNSYSAEIDFAGELASADRGRIHAALVDGKYFLPTQVGLPHLIIELPDASDLADGDWGPWHALVSLETDRDDFFEPGRMSGDGNLPEFWFEGRTAPTLEDLGAAFPADAAQWAETEQAEAVLAELRSDAS